MVVLGLIACFSACSKDNNDKIDNHEEHTEFEWKRAEFTFRRGHLHGTNFHGNPENSLFPTQKYIFEKDDAGNVVRKNAQGNILAAGEEPLILQAKWQYGLEIVYFNEAGERVNSALTTPEALPHHQHFFVVERYTKTTTSEVIENQEGLMEYEYRDTNPENIQKDLAIDPNNPRKGRSVLSGDKLGLKGYFTPKIPYTKFDLKVMLLHINSGTKHNTPSPFNAPSADLLSRSEKDFQAIIPVHIFTTPSTGEVGDYDRYINDLATFFGKTADEIRDLIRRAADEAENSTYWM